MSLSETGNRKYYLTRIYENATKKYIYCKTSTWFILSKNSFLEEKIKINIILYLTTKRSKSAQNLKILTFVQSVSNLGIFIHVSNNIPLNYNLNKITQLFVI